MKVVDTRELQHHLGRCLDAVERGEVIEVRRHRKVIARIVPFSDAEPEAPWPDLVKRLERVFPEGPIGEAATNRLYEDRNDR